jgi:hypothetical protein
MVRVPRVASCPESYKALLHSRVQLLQMETLEEYPLLSDSDVLYPTHRAMGTASALLMTFGTGRDGVHKGRGMPHYVICSTLFTILLHQLEEEAQL